MGIRNHCRLAPNRASRINTIKLVALFLCVIPSPVLAISEHLTKQELALLPPYCSCTITNRDIAGCRISLDDLIDMYGEEYRNLHHYCWALHEERKAASAPLKPRENELSRLAWLGRSLDNVEYSLRRCDDDFALMPEILLTHARILHSLGMHARAIESLTKAIRIKPDYLPAYVKLSDLYLATGDRTGAVRTLENGLRTTPGNTLIISKLRDLGVTPDDRYISPVADRQNRTRAGTGTIAPGGQAHASDEPATTPGVLSQESSDTGAVPESPGAGGTGTSDNPYCRFCPD